MNDKKSTLRALGLLLVLAVCSGAIAAPISVQTVAELEQRFVDATGEAQTRLVPADAVVPGDQVIYTVTFTNTGNEPAQQIVITDPVPEQMRYVDGSAFGPGTDITFSIDGGNSFAAAAQLVVRDAQGRERPARASDFTHIRWGFRHVLAPGERGYARFKAVLD